MNCENCCEAFVGTYEGYYVSKDDKTMRVCTCCKNEYVMMGWIGIKVPEEEESEVKPTFKYHLSYEDADLDTESFVDLETARVAMKAVIGKGQYSWVQIIEGFDAVVEEWESASVETEEEEEECESCDFCR